MGNSLLNWVLNKAGLCSPSKDGDQGCGLVEKKAQRNWTEVWSKESLCFPGMNFRILKMLHMRKPTVDIANESGVLIAMRKLQTYVI